MRDAQLGEDSRDEDEVALAAHLDDGDAQRIGIVAQPLEQPRKGEALGLTLDEHHGRGEEHLVALVVELRLDAHALLLGQQLVRRAQHGQTRPMSDPA